jgi:glyoxylase-like metal-dependent hydrolase (beta-lactamase superfamily II)
MEGPVYRIKGRISNVYLINGERIAIVDTGSPNDLSAILFAIRKELRRNVREVDFIIPTHSHIEHMGNAGKIKRKTGAKIALPYKNVDPTKGVLNNPQFLKDMPRAIFAGIKNNPSLLLHPFKHLKKLTADIVLSDGMEIPGHPGWNVLLTPGHSPESICLFHKSSKSLVSGDTIITIDSRPCLPFGISDRTQMNRSISKIKELDVQYLYPGHGEPISGNKILDNM